MAVKLEDPDTVRLARAVASLTAEFPAVAVQTALAEQLEWDKRGQRPTPSLAERLLALGREMADVSDLDGRTPDEIMGYDDRGIW